MFKKCALILILSLNLSSKIFALHCSDSITLSQIEEDTKGVQVKGVALDNKGNAIVSWFRVDSGDREAVEVATKRAGEDWSPSLRLSSWQEIDRVYSSIDSEGNFTVSWEFEEEKDDDYEDCLQYTRKLNRENIWSPPLVFSADEEDKDSEKIDRHSLLHFSSNPNFYFWKFEDVRDSNYSIYLEGQFYSQGKWSKLEKVGPIQNSFLSTMSADANANKDAIFVWENYFSAIQAVNYSSGAWSSFVNISSPQDEAEFPKVKMDSQGNCIAVWNIKRNYCKGIGAAFKPVGKDWQPSLEFFPENGEYDSPGILEDQGKFVLLWQHLKRNRAHVLGCVLDMATSQCTSPVVLSGSLPLVADYAAALGGNGRGLIAFHTIDTNFEPHVMVSDLIVDD